MKYSIIPQAVLQFEQPFNCDATYIDNFQKIDNAINTTSLSVNVIKCRHLTCVSEYAIKCRHLTSLRVCDQMSSFDLSLSQGMR